MVQQVHNFKYYNYILCYNIIFFKKNVVFTRGTDDAESQTTKFYQRFYDIKGNI